MKQLFTLLIFIGSLTSLVKGQSGVKGVIRDTTGFPLPGALVNLESGSHRMATAADVSGGFLFTGIKDSLINIRVRFMGFDSLRKAFTIDLRKQTNDLGEITIYPASNVLDEVVVVAVNPIVLKEDTVQYDARAYPVREGDAVEEIVKKLPGVDVDKDGNITANGEPITSIRLDGKEYFGNDVAAAIQNLPADIVKNLQVIDDYGEQANLTGLKNGTPEKVLNINIKPDKKEGYFAKTTAGYGSEERYTGRISGNYLNKEQQLALEANMNNTRSRSSGVTDNKSIKLNYRDKWSKKLESYGSYRFNSNDNSTIQKTNSQNFFPDYTRLEDEQANNKSGSNEHRFSWNFEYRPDTSNYLKVEPDLSFESADGLNLGFTNTRLLGASSLRNSRESSTESSSDLALEVFYNHKFQKAKRNFSLELELSSTSGEGNGNMQNDYTNTDSLNNTQEEQQYQNSFNNNRSIDMEVDASYFEPLSQSSFLELAYEWRRSSNDRKRETRDINPLDQSETLNANLSNNYDYDFTTNRFGLNYRLKTDKINSTIGLFAQPSVLEGKDHSRQLSTYQRNFNWVPSLRFAYQFSRERQLILNYRGTNNLPDFRRLQPVTDNSNLQNTVTGNPNLKPEFNHASRLEYRQTNVKSGSSFHAGLAFAMVEDKIVTTKTIIPDSIKQETSYTNTNGAYNTSGRYAISIPFRERKFVLTYYGGSDFQNNIAITNEERIIGKSFGVRQGLKFRFNLEDIIDSEINTSYAYNNASFSSATIEDRSSSQINIRLDGRNYFFKDLTLGYDFSKEINNGYNASINNPVLLSLYLEHRFLKNNKGSIRLQGFDLFGQNTGIQRDIFDNEIIDRQSNRLSTYFLLSFNYRFQQFGG